MRIFFGEFGDLLKLILAVEAIDDFDLSLFFVKLRRDPTPLPLPLPDDDEDIYSGVVYL